MEARECEGRNQCYGWSSGAYGVLEVNECEGYLVSVCEGEGLIIRNT